MGLPAMNFQVVVLAGGLSKKLYPLVSKDVPKALLPLGNKPVLSYVLELLEASNLKDIILVAAGEDAALCVGNWVADAVHDRLRVEVRTNSCTPPSIVTCTKSKPPGHCNCSSSSNSIS